MIPENERQIFADVYRFYTTYRLAQSEEAFKAASTEMSKIDCKYNSKLCRNLLLAVWESLPEK